MNELERLNSIKTIKVVTRYLWYPLKLKGVFTWFSKVYIEQHRIFFYGFRNRIVYLWQDYRFIETPKN